MSRFLYKSLSDDFENFLVFQIFEIFEFWNLGVKYGEMDEGGEIIIWSFFGYLFEDLENIRNFRWGLEFEEKS